MEQTDNKGWNEYSRLVISELERLNDGISKLDLEIQYVKREIAELKIQEDAVKELKKWKDNVDDVTSPTQLKDTIKDVSDLKTFKTQAITVWLVVQVLFGIALAIIKLL